MCLSLFILIFSAIQFVFYDILSCAAVLHVRCRPVFTYIYKVLARIEWPT
jgi:hypothetical protein